MCSKMSGGGTQQSLRKALGALKDTTKVGLAKVNSEYKDLDIAIVKATNHVERPAKEKHIQIIFAATSAARPRADVAYCIHALARRLAKTHNWAVALKTLIVIHRALREVDPTFREELINYSRSRGHMLNLSHFKDDSSPNAWDYSAWVRAYALFLEERLECYRVLKYDIETERLRTRELDTVDLLEQLPALQQFLFRLIGCQPEGAAISNYVIQYAVSLVSRESIKLYNAINDGTINLVDKFFEMQRNDALKALEIYRRAGKQTERLSEFYEVCKGVDLGRGPKFPPLEQPPASFINAMEEYVRDAPRASSARRELQKTESIPKVLALEYKKKSEPEDDISPSPSPPPPPPSEPVKEEAAPVQHATPDLLGLDDISPDPSALEERNALALAIVPATDTASNGNLNNALDLSNGATGWELALVTTSTSSSSVQVESKLAGGLDKLTLDSLYDDAMRRQTNPSSNYHMGQVAPNPFEATPMLQPGQDPFYASNKIAPPSAVQMASMAYQQQAFLAQQQMMGQQVAPNPFGNPYQTTHPYAAGPPYQAQNPYGNAGYMM
ncbi:putative clathrin assembly protein At5g35200 isoform X1 [Cryptomeria japonica]|uniref:putative clathrin assembly protein At5g35200 isoform X1 n=2 Tax=Cryptomeria japonica TaxID=3369 RepID=UPI0025AB92B3|nr:putative clathrin assembly protein At5g35200 isoform X1 [Cryptomeria japonica]